MTSRKLLALGLMGATTILFSQSPKETQKAKWTGALEWLSPTSLTLRVSDGRIVAIVLPPSIAPSPAEIAAGHNVGDLISSITDVGKGNITASEIKFAGTATGNDLSRALASPAWREPGNLLPHPDAPPVAAAPAAPAELEHARDVILGYIAKMPNYIALESSVRSSGSPNRAVQIVSKFDLISDEVTWDGHQETHDHVKRNGVDWPLSMSELPGIEWFGGFAGRLTAIFGRNCPNTFVLDQRRIVRGVTVVAYRFHAAPDGCVGKFQVGPVGFYPGTQGVVTLDAGSGNIVGLQENTIGLPPEFGIESLADTIAWGQVGIDNASYLLPVSSHVTFVLTGRKQFLIDTEYKNYRRFATSTKITIH